MPTSKSILTIEKPLVPLGFNQLPAAALTGSITAATKALPCVITSTAHGLATGQKIVITSVVGMTQLNVAAAFTITKIDANSFSLNLIDSTGYTTYVSGGTWTLAATGLAAGLDSNAVPTGAVWALVQAEAQAVRWRDDGNDPTTTVGMVIASGSSHWFRITVLSAIKIIRAAAAGIINISFYKELD